MGTEYAIQHVSQLKDFRLDGILHYGSDVAGTLLGLGFGFALPVFIGLVRDGRENVKTGKLPNPRARKS